MSETASGIARLAILFIATASFSLIWAGDQQVQQQFALARKEAAERAAGVQLADDGRSAESPLQRKTDLPVSVRHPASRPTLNETGEMAYITRVEVEMALPYGIAPGRYQVVDLTGLVQMIHITVTDRPADPRRLYSLEQPGGGRRYFIRLNDSAVQGGEPVRISAGKHWPR